jgi:hypothetical protein
VVAGPSQPAVSTCQADSVAKEVCDLCTHGEHENCPHKLGFGRKFLKWSELSTPLCACSCHSSCLLWGFDWVAARQWADECTCGSAFMRENFKRRPPSRQ